MGRSTNSNLVSKSALADVRLMVAPRLELRASASEARALLSVPRRLLPRKVLGDTGGFEDRGGVFCHLEVLGRLTTGAAFTDLFVHHVFPTSGASKGPASWAPAAAALLFLCLRQLAPQRCCFPSLFSCGGVTSFQKGKGG